MTEPVIICRPLLCKSMDWFLHGNGLRHERVNTFLSQGILMSVKEFNEHHIRLENTVNLSISISERDFKNFRKRKEAFALGIKYFIGRLKNCLETMLRQNYFLIGLLLCI